MQANSRNGDLAIAVLLLALAAFFLWGASRMPAGTFAVPGPGILPTILGALLALTACALLVKALIGRARTPGTPVPFSIAPVAIVFTALTGVAFALERAGFVLTMCVFLFVMLRVFSRLGTMKSALLAVTIALVTVWFFNNLLGVNLPRIPW